MNTRINTHDTSATVTFPTLNEGERHVATLIKPDGTGFHLIRMAAMPADEMDWDTAMQFAKDGGGELPDRVEGALLFQTRQPDEFENEWYWTREQLAGGESYVWVQSFNYGYQGSSHKDNEFRVVLVRRVAI